jgi:hypothetical protein
MDPPPPPLAPLPPLPPQPPKGSPPYDTSEERKTYEEWFKYWMINFGYVKGWRRDEAKKEVERVFDLLHPEWWRDEAKKEVQPLFDLRHLPPPPPPGVPKLLRSDSECDCGKKVFYMTHYGVPHEAQHPDLQCRC